MTGWTMEATLRTSGDWLMDALNRVLLTGGGPQAPGAADGRERERTVALELLGVLKVACWRPGCGAVSVGVPTGAATVRPDGGRVMIDLSAGDLAAMLGSWAAGLPEAAVPCTGSRPLQAAADALKAGLDRLGMLGWRRTFAVDADDWRPR